MKARSIAGGILWRAEGPETVVALTADGSNLPQDEVRHGEHAIVRAYTEITAFSGHTPVIGGRVGRFDRNRRHVHFWEMRLPPDATPPRGLRWVPAGEAASVLADSADRKAAQRFAAMPRPDATVLLVRHGLAGDKAHWDGPDELRPLDEKGRRQAVQLQDVLPFWRPGRVISAPKVRCTQTVAPLADALGLPVEEESVFSEDCNADDVLGALQRLTSVAPPGATTVICSQGGVIPELVAALHVSAGLPAESIRAKKGSTWALQFAGQRLVHADYYPHFSAAPA